jgi:hypothetical protein
VGQPEGKRPLGRQVGGWIILKWTLEWQDGVVRTGLIWLRTSGGLLWTRKMNLRVPQNVAKFLSSWATGGLSRRAQLHGAATRPAAVVTGPVTLLSGI